MISNTHRFALSATALAAALILAGCGRNDEASSAQADATPSTASPNSTAGTSGSTGSTAPSTSTASTGESSTGTAGTSPSGTSGNAVGTSGTSSAGTQGATTSSTMTGANAPSTAALPAADAQFVTKAAEGGQFEVEIGKLAATKATDAAVKSFAQMLVDDHTAANDKLRQIASSHNVALPAALPADKKKEIEQLGKLSGAEFDRQFVKTVGIKDHHHDIDEFEKAAKSAKSDDVRDFAQSTLPTLKKHLAAAEKLPMGGGKAKG